MLKFKQKIQKVSKQITVFSWSHPCGKDTSSPVTPGDGKSGWLVNILISFPSQIIVQVVSPHFTDVFIK